jgi:hypothetical protein
MGPFLIFVSISQGQAAVQHDEGNNAAVRKCDQESAQGEREKSQMQPSFTK